MKFWMPLLNLALELSPSWTTLDSQLVHPQNPNHFTCCACSTVSGENTTHLGRREVLWLWAWVDTEVLWIPPEVRKMLSLRQETPYENIICGKWIVKQLNHFLISWSSSLSRENLFTNKKAWQTIKCEFGTTANMLIFCKGTVCLLAGKLHDSRDEPWWPGEKCW